MFHPNICGYVFILSCVCVSEVLFSVGVCDLLIFFPQAGRTPRSTAAMGDADLRYICIQGASLLNIRVNVFCIGGSHAAIYIYI